MPKVSVIISSYNHADFIGLAIDSVLNQTWQDFEIIISDDASTDHTEMVVQPYLSDPRIQYYAFTENRVGHMKNNCLQYAKGEYIAVLNSDDLFHPCKLEEQVKILDKQKEVGAVFTGVAFISEKGTIISNRENIFVTQNRNRQEWLYHFLNQGNCLCHSSVLMRMSLLKEIGFYNRWLAVLSDFDLWVRICLHSELYIISEVYTYNRLLAGEKNASGARPDVYNRYNIEVSQIIENYYSETALSQLVHLFPDNKDFQTQKKTELIYFLSHYLKNHSNKLVRNLALHKLYALYRDPKTLEELVSSLGVKIIPEYYKTTGTTVVHNTIFTVIEIHWYSENQLIQKDEVLFSEEALQELYFKVPSIVDQKNIKLSIYPGNPNRKVHIKSLQMTHDQKTEYLNLIERVIRAGYHILLDKPEPGLCFIPLDKRFYLEVPLHSDEITMKNLFLKITFTSTPEIKYEDYKVSQNLEYISAKRLLSSLVKKLLNRIKSLI